MMAQTKIEVVRYTLDRVHVHGRKSLEGILSAMRKLSTWNGLGKGFNYKMVQVALDSVVVSGEEDVNQLLACIQTLDELIEEENNGTENE